MYTRQTWEQTIAEKAKGATRACEFSKETWLCLRAVTTRVRRGRGTGRARGRGRARGLAGDDEGKEEEGKRTYLACKRKPPGTGSLVSVDRSVPE